MIRAENAITELVQGLEESGTLVTENILKGEYPTISGRMYVRSVSLAPPQ